MFGYDIRSCFRRIPQQARLPHFYCLDLFPAFWGHPRTPPVAGSCFLPFSAGFGLALCKYLPKFLPLFEGLAGFICREASGRSWDSSNLYGPWRLLNLTLWSFFALAEWV